MRLLVNGIMLLCMAVPLFAGPLEVTEGAFTFRKELIGVHPRLLLNAETVKTFKERAAGTHKDFFDEMVRQYDTEMNKKYVDGPPATYAEMAKMGEGALYGMGNWILTGKAMLYQITGEKKYLNDARKWMLAIAGYEKMPKDNLVVMDILTGVSITYDWLYQQLSEKERKTVRAFIHREVKRQLAFFSQDSYWTADWQNNHRWNRMMGMLSGIGAIYGDDPALDMQPFGDAMVAQINELLRWLPVEGGCHEGPGYWSYGHKFLIIGLECFRSVTGRQIFNEHEFFATSGRYRLYATTPGWKGSFNMGDSGPGFGNCNSNLYLLASLHKDAYLQGWLQDVRKKDISKFFPPQWGFLWYDPALKAADYTELPLCYYDADLELLIARESWDDDAAGFAFKCGYAGGRLLNQLRVTRTPDAKDWVNVAHDHPDQNHFLFFDGGTMLAEDDGYAHKLKAAENHNTLLVDGKGQAGENKGWMAPYPEFRSGYVFDVCTSGGTAYIAGDAGRAYDGIDRFARHAFFMKGDYLLLIDDIRGDGGKHAFETRLHSRGDWKKDAEGRYTVTKKDAGMKVAMLQGAITGETLLPEGEEVGPALSLSVKDAENVALITLLTGGSEPRALADKCSVTEGPGSTVFKIKDNGINDIIAVRSYADHLTGDGFDTDARMLTVRKAGTPLVMATEVRNLAVGGEKLLAADNAVRYVRTVGDGIITVRLEQPFSAVEAYDQQISLGGFEAGKTYGLTVDGIKADDVAADKDGVVAVKTKLAGPKTYALTLK